VTLALGEGQIRYLTWSSNSTIVAEDPTPAARWWTYRLIAGDRQPLWAGSKAPVGDLRQLTWGADGQAAAISFGKDGAQLWMIGNDGDIIESRAIKGRVSFPSWTDGHVIACIVDARLTVPCGEKKQVLEPDVDVYGPIAFKGRQAYFASPDGNGSVALWTADMTALKARRMSSFSRDAYAPSVGGNTVVFKTQSYRTFVADAPATGGPARQLATFQSETPSYHPTRPLIAFTYGTWRRIVDDAKYPDIAQEIGVIDITQAAPAEKPLDVIAHSDSEDQAMAWSPNGKWIAFHTHREMSDDVWLRPADGSQPDKRITFLGRGAEVGWPRWSPDGKSVLLEGGRKSDGRSVLFTIGINQESGATTSELREIRADGFEPEMGHGEWLGNDRVIAVAKEGPGRHVILTLPVAGGVPRIVHRYATEHDFSGLAVSPGGKFVAFAAPAPDGYYQIFTKGIEDGSSALQITSDRSHKTQPAWSPGGARIAFTVWSYDATFWSFNAR
jgi:WD40 repeat protein